MSRDGNFPTVKSPNPEEPAAMEMAISKAREIDADLVMATDPDADRVGIAVKDQEGEDQSTERKPDGLPSHLLPAECLVGKGKIAGTGIHLQNDRHYRSAEQNGR